MSEPTASDPAADVQDVERAKIILSSDAFGYDAKEYARLYLALVARVDTLTRERDALQGRVYALETALPENYREALEAAESALADTRRALEQIAALESEEGTYAVVPSRDGWLPEFKDIARRALAAGDKPEPEK